MILSENGVPLTKLRNERKRPKKRCSRRFWRWFNIHTKGVKEKQLADTKLPIQRNEMGFHVWFKALEEFQSGISISISLIVKFDYYI